LGGVAGAKRRTGRVKFLTDLPVLAEGAAQIAPGEKDGSGTARTGDGRLFAEVQSGVRKQNIAPDFAETGFASQPVGAAPARTAFASVQLL